MEYSPSNAIDPFYLYMRFRELLGAGEVFLLEAGREDMESAYQMSLVGVCPIVEAQVRDHVVSVFAVPELADELFPHISPYGELIEQAPVSWPSTVVGGALHVKAADPFAVLERLRKLLSELCTSHTEQPFSAGFLGYVGYDAIRYLERLPQTTVDDRQLPEIRLQWHAGIVQLVDGRLRLYRQDDAARLHNHDGIKRALDSVQAELIDIASRGLGAPESLVELERHGKTVSRVTYDIPEDVFCNNVRTAMEYIRAGDIFQVVLSTRIRIAGGLHPFVAYNRLRRLNPSPYMFVAEYEGMMLYGASPEVQFRCIGGLAEMKPIAGTTRGRGRSADEDARLVAELKADAKENAEHVMLVDLCRNDLGRIAKSGTVHVPDFMVVERYSHLYHLVSRVEAELRDDVSVFHALLTTYPNGTLSGAPKIRAMEIIDELEPVRRGPYGGFVGMVDAWANANTAIVIRSVIVVGESQYVQAGAGIVLDSIPEREWQECHHKAGAILDVLTGHHQPETMIAK
ncbi:anthranilate synthase component I family protein [Alicyclobacillus sacchari]|nr:anthranilate synthase component I family protein [Alicyclobacillus sacchari]